MTLRAVSRPYEAIVKGEPIPQPGIPESFRVMLKELQSLGMDVVVQDKGRQQDRYAPELRRQKTSFDMRDVTGSKNITNKE